MHDLHPAVSVREVNLRVLSKRSDRSLRTLGGGRENTHPLRVRLMVRELGKCILCLNIDLTVSAKLNTAQFLNPGPSIVLLPAQGDCRMTCGVSTSSKPSQPDRQPPPKKLWMES